MRTVQVAAADHAPHIVEEQAPTPTPGTSLLTMEAVGLHQVVRSRAAGRHYTSTFPMTLGVDGVGRTEDGRRVWCMTMDHSGRGTLAEQVVVPDELLVPLPDGLDAVATAAAVNPLIAAWMSLSVRGGLTAGAHLVVLGATGAAGRGTLALARGIAARRTAVGRDRARLERLLAEGLAEDVIEIGDDDAMTAAAASVDLCVDYLWGPVAESLWSAVARASRTPGQRLVHVETGTMAGAEARLDGALLRSRDVRVLGSAPGAYDLRELIGEVPTLLQRMADEQLDVEHTAYGLDELDAAWAHAGAGRAVIDLRR